MDNRIKSILIGILSSFGILAFYFLTMRILGGSWYASFSQFEKLWYYMIPLSLGFGVQVGLYVSLKNTLKKKASNKVMMANSTTSTVGMIACCAHHLTDVSPIIGLSAVSVFLIQFQIPLLILGIVSNIMGIVYLLKITKRSKLISFFTN